MPNATGGASRPKPQYEDTRKAKAQADKISADIAKKMGYDSPKTRSAPTPKSSPKQQISPAEKQQNKALADLMKKRAAVAKKTGSYPNYKTN